MAVECPVCGLALGQRTLTRPLLFQASALQATAPPAPAPQALRAPALGRVAPVDLPALPSPEALDLGPPSETALVQPDPRDPAGLFETTPNEPPTSLWPLVVMEGVEAAQLLGVNALVGGVACLASGVGPTRLYTEQWPFLLALHGAVSWALILVPLVLTGQTLPMAPRGLALASDQPERRITFSLLHLLSVLAWPLSFLCLVLTAEHRTLAELLSGQEILQRPVPRLR